MKKTNKLASFLIALVFAVLGAPAHAASVWLGDAAGTVYRVDPATGQVLFQQSGVSPKDMAVAADQSLWALGQGHLRKYSTTGSLIIDVSLATDDLVGAKVLSGNRYTGQLWVADVNASASVKQVVELDNAGTRQTAFTSPGGTRSLYTELNGNLWVLGNGQAVHFSPSGSQIGLIAPGVAFSSPASMMAVDPVRNVVWLVGGAQAAAYDATSPGAALHSITAPQSIVGLDVDAATGDVWIAHGGGVLVLKSDGTQRLSVSSSSISSPTPQTITYDAGSKTAWLGYAGGVAILDANGAVVSRLVLNQTVEWISAQAFIPRPTVALNASPNGPVLAAPATVALSASASELGPSIAKVEFFQGTQSLGASTTTPYQVNVPALPSGAYSFTAVATDVYGTSATSSPVAITSDNLPTVSISAPPPNLMFTSPGTVTLTASASDSDGSVASVEFFNGATSFGAVSPPFSKTVSGLPSGRYSVTAVATDNLGLSTTSAPLSFVVDTPPTIALTAPTSGSVVNAPGTVGLAATASDSDGTVAKVDFYQGATFITSVTAAPFTASASGLAAGSYTFTAVATDDLGATTTSAPVSVTVNAPPVVALTGPSVGAIFTPTSTIALTANASDPDGTVAKVEFFRSGVSVGTALSAPYSASMSSVAAGQYVITAIATDDRGATTTSQPVSITVDAPPTVSISAPVDGAKFKAPADITLTASAGDADGSVAKVEYYQGDTLIGTGTGVSFTFTWTGVAQGTYTIVSKATDDLGVTTPSAPITVAVSAAGPQIYYVHADSLGTPRLITRPADNQVMWEWDTGEPFGNTPPNANPSSTGSFVYNFRFPGQYFDSEIGTSYNDRRDYDQTTGRYVESDPLGLAGGLATYAYVGGNPIRWGDRWGLTEPEIRISGHPAGQEPPAKPEINGRPGTGSDPGINEWNPEGGGKWSNPGAWGDNPGGTPFPGADRGAADRPRPNPEPGPTFDPTPLLKLCTRLMLYAFVLQPSPIGCGDPPETCSVRHSTWITMTPPKK